MNPPIALAADAGLPRRSTLGALAALFVLTLRQHVRGRKLLVLSLLFALPAALAALVALASRYSPRAASLEFAFVLNLIPHALVPLAALLYSASIIQDEIEDQTLTYLLLRPLPRPALYLVKLLATLVLSAALVAVFTTITLVVIDLTASEPSTAGLLGRAVKTSLLLALAQVGYCGLFGLLGLLMRRSLLVGVAYIVLFEGLLASFDTIARRLTVMYYFRVLVLRWMEPAGGHDWSIDLAKAPGALTCVLVLLSTGLVLSVAASLYFAVREFRVKTPEGS